MGNELKLGKVLIHLSNTQSTNDYVSQLLTKSTPLPGTVVSADYQSDGKGQFGNKWQSEYGKNLLLSVYIRPEKLKAPESFQLNVATTLAICSFLDQKLNKKIAAIKWPNDIIVDGKKIGGILIQNSIAGRLITESIIGIGLNVNQTEFLHDYNNYHPISMANYSGKNFERGELLIELLHCLEYFLTNTFENPYQFGGYFTNRLYGNGGLVKLKSKDTGKVMEGRILEVNNVGACRFEFGKKYCWLNINDWKMLLNGE